MNYELSQRFFFDAAHTLRREMEATGSRRVHGHTYQVEVSVRGQPNPHTGMVLDLGVIRARVQAVKATLDHHFLDEVPGLGIPTLENICAFIAGALSDLQPHLSAVTVWREGIGDRCRLTLSAD